MDLEGRRDPSEAEDGAWARMTGRMMGRMTDRTAARVCSGERQHRSRPGPWCRQWTEAASPYRRWSGHPNDHAALVAVRTSRVRQGPRHAESSKKTRPLPDCAGVQLRRRAGYKQSRMMTYEEFFGSRRLYVGLCAGRRHWGLSIGERSRSVRRRRLRL